MTYEVYIEVRHHPRHLDDYEEYMSTAFKLTDPPATYDCVAGNTVDARLDGIARLLTEVVVTLGEQNCPPSLLEAERLARMPFSCVGGNTVDEK